VIDLINGECLAEMDKLIEKGVKVDAIICDPPYGTTACKWDSIIDFEQMWFRLNKLIKPNGAIVLFGSEPFSSALRMSNIKNYKYDWVWEKHRPSGFAQAKNKPLANHEIISVFSTGVTVHASQSVKRMPYFPQNLVRIDKKVSNNSKSFNKDSVFMNRKNAKDDYIQEFTNYPKSTLKVCNETGLHPTQKPVVLMEYLIKTYTNEGETVLDFTMGSGTTMLGCKNLNRNGIGIELDKGYFDIAVKRLEEQ
jgi:site-specific DNA-methyltransferase (adenine-specific)